jgi:hypothetical protein
MRDEWSDPTGHLCMVGRCPSSLRGNLLYGLMSLLWWEQVTETVVGEAGQPMGYIWAVGRVLSGGIGAALRGVSVDTSRVWLGHGVACLPMESTTHGPYVATPGVSGALSQQS